MNRSSSIRICKLMRPSKLAWLTGNGPFPTQGYINYLERINEVNAKIDDFNESNGFKNVLGFSLEGMRAGKKRRRNGTTVLSHMWSAWREVEQGHQFCLHLKEEKRIGMMRKLVRYIGHQMTN